MKNKITTLLLFCMVAVTALGGPVSREKAAEIARSYLLQHRVSRGAAQPVDISLAYECVSKAGRGAGIGTPLYYVFNQGKSEGFVVVSGDDRMTPVVGFAGQGNFDYQNVNPNFRWWLGALEETMLSLAKSKTSGRQFFPSAADGIKTAVEPLVKVHWGQGAPYNDRCPQDPYHGYKNSLVGCAAVALSQVLSRWEYPAKPEGNVSFTTTTHRMPLSANLSDFTFHWDRLLPIYRGDEGTPEQRDAIAELMYACGLAIEMDYCALESAALVTGHRLRNHFCMDNTSRIAYRIYFSRDEWDAMVKRELSEGRPVVYSGYNLNKGHAFVCDGYNADGLFHINWGWDTLMDGYFALAELNSAAEKAGAPTDADGSYNMDQMIVMGIQPKVGQGTPVEHRLFYYSLKPKGHASRANVSVEVSHLNTDEDGFRGEATMGIFSGDGEFVGNIENMIDVNLKASSYMYPTTISGAVPEDLPDGSYLLSPICQPEGDEYAYLMRGRVGAPFVSYLVMRVKGNQVTVSEPKYVKADLKVVSVRPLNDKCYAGVKNPLEITVRNDGATYNGPLVLTRKIGGEDRRVYGNNYIIEPGEECKMYIKVTAPEGQTRDVLGLWYAESDEDDFYSTGFRYGFIQNFDYQLTQTVPGAPRISIDRLSIQNPSIMEGEKLDVDVTLSNTGGFYGGPFTLHVFQPGSNQHVGRGSYDIFLDGGQSLSFHLQVNTEHIPEGEYFMQAFLGNTLISYDQFKFNVVSTGTIQVDSPEGFDVLCLPNAFQVPGMMKCGVVTAADTENMKIDYRYRTGNVVPAGTPVIVCVEEPGIYTYNLVKSKEQKPADNLLSAQVDENGYTYAGEGNYWYYGFTCTQNFDNYGFYAYVENAAPFLLPSQKCYLAMPAGYGAPYYPFKLATGIRNRVLDADAGSGRPVYNLTGARVYGKMSELPKGVYIVGGKKKLIR